MALRFLGKDPSSPDGGSPTLYYDDQRDTYVVQGWRITDERLSEMDIPGHETVVEIPSRMLQFLPEVKSGI